MSAGKHTGIARMAVTAWLCLALIFVMPMLMIQPEMEIQVVPEIELLPEVKSDPETEGKKPFWKRFLLIAGIVMAALLVLLVAYVVLAHLAPDFMDSILYTPEELVILNRTL